MYWFIIILDFMNDNSVLKKITEKKLFCLCIAGGGLLRLWQAIYNYTPMAQDDYAHVIGPALNSLQTGAGLKILSHRMEILAVLFRSFMALPHALGVEDPRVLVSCGYTVLAILSVLSIAGMYKLAGNILKKDGQIKILLLFSFYFALPFLSTRVLQGTLVLLPVPWAYYFLTRPKPLKKDWFLGSFFLGLAVIIRFQIGILFLAGLFWFFIDELIEKRKQSTLIRGMKIRFTDQIIPYLAGGLTALALMAVLDGFSGRVPFSTLWEYVKLNFSGNISSQVYGKAPWYDYLSLFLGLFIPPFSFILFWPFLRSFKDKKILLLTISLVFFVLFHSLIANKLTRFMFPVVPLFFIITVYGLEKYGDKKIFHFSWKGFWVLNFFLLIFVFFAKSQTNIIDAAAWMRSQKAPLYLYNIKLWKQGYCGYDRPSPVRVAGLDTFLKWSAGSDDVLLLYSKKLTDDETEQIRSAGRTVNLERSFKPSPAEALVIVLNPAGNRRRKTTYMYRIKKGNDNGTI